MAAALPRASRRSVARSGSTGAFVAGGSDMPRGVLAAEKHKKQLRKIAGGTPYINHPLAAADLLASVAGVTGVVVLAAGPCEWCGCRAAGPVRAIALRPARPVRVAV